MAKKQQSNRRAPVSPGKLAAAVVFSAVVLSIAAALLWRFCSPFPRLEVDGFRISQEEYLRAMYQARNEVLSDHAAAGISLKDWDTQTPLGDPRRLTAQRALELLREYYAVSTLAVERGYLANAGYDAMLKDLEELNAQRQEALASGTVITGLPRFSTDDFLTYRASSIRLQFCNDPENPENQVTQEQILQRYEADRDNLYRQPDSVELAFVTADASLAQDFQALHQKALETGSLAAAMEELPQLQAYFQEISVTPGNYASYARTHSDVLAYSLDLSSGELSQVLNVEGWLYLIECRQRTVHGCVPLEDVQSVVIQSILESRYDALIAQRAEAIEIRGDLEKLYRFTAQQLP